MTSRSELSNLSDDTKEALHKWMDRYSVHIPVGVLKSILQEEKSNQNKPLHDYLGRHVVEAIEDWYIS
jgi:hypothetical protein